MSRLLFHGTTLSAAEAILQNGWVEMAPQKAVAAIAGDLHAPVAEIWADLARGQVVSCTATYGAAAHRWAQRAPEIRREALRAVYRRSHSASPFACSVREEVWLLPHMLVDPPAVVSIAVAEEGWPECRIGGFEVGQSVADFANAPGYEPLMLEALPEIVLSVSTPHTILTISEAPRLIDSGVARHLVGLGRDDWTTQTKGGVFGEPTRDSMGYLHWDWRHIEPHVLAERWDPNTVEE